ncbi:hypothetical protein BUE80_DR008252, partial [Diplocarpon rosae]
PEKRKSKDDSALDSNPTTPQRPAFSRGLSLRMPARDLMSPGTSAHIKQVPLSPKLDHSQTYGSPTSVLPRRSRGLNFSRAATNLHHSTLAESSPDSSPITSGRAINIPNRKNVLHFTAGCDSSNNNLSSLWSTMANADRMTVSSSLGSVNMMSESSGSSSDGDDPMDADDIDDSILTTPQVNNTNGAFGALPVQSPGSGWARQSPAVSSLMNFQRARLRNGKSRKSSSSGSGNSMVSPRSKSPPAMLNIDGTSNGCFGRDMAAEGSRTRRESISWAANQLHISGSESDDGTLKSTLENVEGLPVTPGRDAQRGVIRRAVTRRGNMLPKTKGFARIRAALAEESAPVETEVRREAEVVRLTRESDMDLEPRHPSISNTTTTHSSPSLGPTAQDSLEGIPEDDIMADISQGLSISPGMSVHNSPILQSPMQREHQPWGSRPSSKGEAGKLGAVGGPKRVGFQGMVDTNDGLMKMSIE